MKKNNITKIKILNIFLFIPIICSGLLIPMTIIVGWTFTDYIGTKVILIYSIPALIISIFTILSSLIGFCLLFNNFFEIKRRNYE
jgi:hypothetical protein